VTLPAEVTDCKVCCPFCGRRDSSDWERGELPTGEPDECYCGATYEVTEIECVRYFTVKAIAPAPTESR
jgi:hypothetical protein